MAKDQTRDPLIRAQGLTLPLSHSDLLLHFTLSLSLSLTPERVQLIPERLEGKVVFDAALFPGPGHNSAGPDQGHPILWVIDGSLVHHSDDLKKEKNKRDNALYILFAFLPVLLSLLALYGTYKCIVAIL